MKNIILSAYILILFIFATADSVAQSLASYAKPQKKYSNSLYQAPPPPTIYWKAFVGGDMKAGQAFLGSNRDLTVQPTIYDAVNGSWGSGFNLGASVGYPLCANSDAELEADFFSGCKYSFYDNYSATQKYSEAGSVHGLYLRPAITLKSDPINCFTPYAKFGLNLPVMTMMNWTTSNTLQGNTTETKKEITQTFQPGAFGSLGVNWQFNNSWGVFGELQTQLQSFTPKHANITEYKVNGVDKMSSLTTTYAKEIDYVNKYTYTSNPDVTKPSQTLAASNTQTSVALVVGISHHFGHCQNATPEQRVAVTPPPVADASKPCNCLKMSIANNAAGNPKRNLNMEKSFDKATKNYSFKITVSADVDMSCTSSVVDKPCEGVFITEIYAGGGTTGFKKVLTEPCGTSSTFPISVTSFYGSSASKEGLDKVNSNVKITFIMLCNGQMKRITQTMEIMGGELVNPKWGKWEDVKDAESKEIQKSYEKSSTEYLRK